jgi:hypothetical protein
LKKQQQKKDKNEDKEEDKDEKQDQQPQPKQPQPQPQQSQMSKESAQQILDALMQDEKNTQEKAKQQPARGAKKAEKDW